MNPSELNTAAVRRQLDKILSSPGFVRNDRLSKFLRFVVEQHLQGKAAELKESLVGIEVFGRTPGFDVRQDSVVRTEAAKLRDRLAQYYSGEGAGDPVMIELPKGGYAPMCRESEKPPEIEIAPRARRTRQFGMAIAAVSGAIAVAALAWWGMRLPNTPISIAVLPLENLSHDPANDYFADGLTDELIRNISIIDGLAVRSRTSSFTFKGKPRNVHEAGKQLGADYILEGSVLRAGQQLRINVQLVRVRDDSLLWSGKFDRELTDILALQDEISRGIVNSLRLKLGQGRRRYEANAEAYDLYLRARASQHGLVGLGQSVRLLQAVIDIDPSFAPAYAGLAVAHVTRSGFFAGDMADKMSKMRSAAAKAIQLDPLSAEAHDALGMVYSRDGEWERSEKSFRRAIEIDRSDSTTYGHLAMYLLLPLGRIEEAITQLRIAEKTDPLSPDIRYNLAYVLIAATWYDEAVSHCEKLPADYSFKGTCLGRARLGQGRIGEAIQIFEEEFKRPISAGGEIWGFRGYAYGRAGRRKEAEKLAAEVPAINPFNQAVIFAGLGDKDRTLEALDRAAAAGPFRVGRALTFPEFALLRGDPRIKALRKKAGLPE